MSLVHLQGTVEDQKAKLAEAYQQIDSNRKFISYLNSQVCHLSSHAHLGFPICRIFVPSGCFLMAAQCLFLLPNSPRLCMSMDGCLRLTFCQPFCLCSATKLSWAEELATPFRAQAAITSLFPPFLRHLPCQSPEGQGMGQRRVAPQACPRAVITVLGAMVVLVGLLTSRI